MVPIRHLLLFALYAAAAVAAALYAPAYLPDVTVREAYALGGLVFLLGLLLHEMIARHEREAGYH